MADVCILLSCVVVCCFFLFLFFFLIIFKCVFRHFIQINKLILNFIKFVSYGAIRPFKLSFYKAHILSQLFIKRKIS